jgi:hypothetical protein
VTAATDAAASEPDAPLPQEPGRCVAVTRSGERCKGRPAPGEIVCHLHGGSGRAAREYAAAIQGVVRLALRKSLGISK